MAEPHSTTAAGIAVGAGIGLTGTFMGAHIDALLIGLLAAVFMSIWLPAISGKLQAASAVGMSSLLAGYGSPVASAWLAVEQTGFKDDPSLRLLFALLIGTTCPTLLPVAIDRARKFIKGRTSE